ncbi:MAG TPA: hypothetical protein VMF61_07395, partial [Candidatus Acidoferrales bacterium]|nr:hypothetical protein [Candidatus Acidoferrales bacterium]
MSSLAVEEARSHVYQLGLPATRSLLEALMTIEEREVPDVLALADAVRRRYCGDGIALEVLYNAKRGGCSEDCNFCSQSARFASGVEPEALSSVDGFVAAARSAHARGAGEFCIVVAVR